MSKIWTAPTQDYVALMAASMFVKVPPQLIQDQILEPVKEVDFRGEENKRDREESSPEPIIRFDFTTHVLML